MTTLTPPEIDELLHRNRVIQDWVNGVRGSRQALDELRIEEYQKVYEEKGKEAAEECWRTFFERHKKTNCV